MKVSLRSQKVMVWWSLIFFEIYLFNLIFMLHMLPPPSPKWSAGQVAAWYVTYGGEIRIGAAIASWTSAWAIPLAVVIAAQMYRHEHRRAPVWTLLGLGGGFTMTLFLVLPPVFFGVAAFSPERPAEVTAIMHELGVLTLVTTDQFLVFPWVAVAVICLMPNKVVNSPFPRWFGYYSIWALLGFEAAAIAYLTKSGLFAWDGFLAFWLPAILFCSWIGILGILLIRAINKQLRELSEAPPNAEELSHQRG